MSFDHTFFFLIYRIFSHDGMLFAASILGVLNHKILLAILTVVLLTTGVNLGSIPISAPQNNRLKMSLAMIFFIIVSALGTYGINQTIIKPLVERPRPCHTYPDTVAKQDQSNTPMTSKSSYLCSPHSSMPSNHAVFFATITGSLLVLGHSLLSWCFILLTFMVSLSRITVGAHYPSDILVGWLFGGGVGWLIGQLILSCFYQNGETTSK
ncbi:MAG: phosphatase PAP2 family protein [Proteobacteria bacterium]|nr:phosphatase PAP2 family protein [Pseudomonadota bacterium]